MDTERDHPNNCQARLGYWTNTKTLATISFILGIVSIPLLLVQKERAYTFIGAIFAAVAFVVPLVAAVISDDKRIRDECASLLSKAEDILVIIETYPRSFRGQNFGTLKDRLDTLRATFKNQRVSKEMKDNIASFERTVFSALKRTLVNYHARDEEPSAADEEDDIGEVFVGQGGDLEATRRHAENTC